MAHLSLRLSLGHLAASSIFPPLRLCDACRQLHIWQIPCAPIFAPISRIPSFIVWRLIPPPGQARLCSSTAKKITSGGCSRIIGGEIQHGFLLFVAGASLMRHLKH